MALRPIPAIRHFGCMKSFNSSPREYPGPELFLRDNQQEYLQASAYAGYDFIFDDPHRKVIELLCCSPAPQNCLPNRAA